ncbi:anti-sigma factor family protein [Streptomyces sp. NPDC088729]|uniref:anti-sigma factor family protein n=1 Tax=Streptomyces sp. NPDC088729 TaxID=3365876 RepID=UPI0038197FA9
MSGTGPTPAEAHLGDRLAALVDGELKHDARERVLAHLATCAKCKAEADAQRRLKSAFAMSASPSPSEGFLARLQGLPGGPGGDGSRPGGPFGDGRPFADEFFPSVRTPGGSTRADSGAPSSPLDGFGYLPAVHGSTAVLTGGSRHFFRIHDVAREADRSPWRGRRFAFAAASAVSLAAIALGGTLPLDTGPEPAPRAEGSGNTMTPLDAETRAAGGTGTASRQGGGALAVGGEGPAVRQPVPAASNAVPPSLGKAPSVLVPVGAPPLKPQVLTTTPSLFGGGSALGGHPFTLPVLNVSAPPLIRQAGAPLLAATAGGAAPKKAAPTPSAPVQDSSAADLASRLPPRR